MKRGNILTITYMTTRHNVTDVT